MPHFFVKLSDDFFSQIGQFVVTQCRQNASNILQISLVCGVRQLLRSYVSRPMLNVLCQRNASIDGFGRMPDILRCSLTMPLDKRQTETGNPSVPIIQTNAKTVPFNTQSTMLWTENDLLNCLFNTYAAMQYAYHTGRITHEKYFEWKLQWSFGSTITHSSPLPADLEALLQSEEED